MISKYEHSEAIASIKVISIFKITQLSCSQKYKYLQQTEELMENDKLHLLAIVDAFLRDAKARKAYA